MTHPTIEALTAAINTASNEAYCNMDDHYIAKAAARVILSAPPSEAEIEAACVAMYGKAWAKFAKGIQDAAIKNMRAAITAARAKCLEEMEGK